MYYVHINKQNYGPYTEEQVRAMVATGKIPANVQIFDDRGPQNWQPLQNFPHLLQAPSKHAQALAVDPAVASIPISGPKDVERTIWEGQPANVTALDAFVKYFLTSAVIAGGYALGRSSLPSGFLATTDLILIGILMLIGLRALWVYLVLKNMKWTLTTERFNYTVGVFSKRTENLELYRIKDIRIFKPFVYRIFGYGAVDIVTSDRTDPYFHIGAIKKSEDLFQLLRKYTERQKRMGPVKGFEII